MQKSNLTAGTVHRPFAGTRTYTVTVANAAQDQSQTDGRGSLDSKMPKPTACPFRPGNGSRPLALRAAAPLRVLLRNQLLNQSILQ